MFPSRNKYIKPNEVDLFTDKPQSQTNTRNISGTCIVRKKRKSGMSKTKPQGMMINKIMVFW